MAARCYRISKVARCRVDFASGATAALMCWHWTPDPLGRSGVSWGRNAQCHFRFSPGLRRLGLGASPRREELLLNRHEAVADPAMSEPRLGECTLY